jgi:hypothetical protein
MTNFKQSNTFDLNNVRGFCVHLPQWTRTIRSSLKGWRFDMRWEQNQKTEAMELVVFLVEDNQNRASYETGMELWRLVVPEARPGCDVQQQHRGLETEAEFKVAHLEWVLGQALYSTLQPEIVKAVEEIQRVLRRTEADLKKAVEENENAVAEISKLNESNVAMNDNLTLACKDHSDLRRYNETLRNALDLAEHALVVTGTKPRSEARVKALEAIKALHEVVQVHLDDSDSPYTGCMGDGEPEPPYVVRKCWFDSVPDESLINRTAELVGAASGLTTEAATKYLFAHRAFVVLPDRWDAFAAGIKKLDVDLRVESTEPPVPAKPIQHYECWFTDQVVEKKILVIKLVREFSGLGLKEAKEATECNGHFFVPFALWPHWQEEIAKTTALWTYKFGKVTTCEW